MKSNIPILLRVSPVEGVAGHVGTHVVRDKNAKEYGELKSANGNGITITGNTGTNGFEFTYKAPIISGDYTLLASCTDDKYCFQLGDDQVWVGVENLISMPASSDYQFIGQTDHHTINTNHYGTETAINMLTSIAQEYARSFSYDPVLHINDISLERGGKFDIDGKWSKDKSHQTHRDGHNIDIRANEDFGTETSAIPFRNYNEFEFIVRKEGCSYRLEYKQTANEHYHLTCR